jgi:hypothetical protein
VEVQQGGQEAPQEARQAERLVDFSEDDEMDETSLEIADSYVVLETCTEIFLMVRVRDAGSDEEVSFIAFDQQRVRMEGVGSLEQLLEDWNNLALAVEDLSLFPSVDGYASVRCCTCGLTLARRKLRLLAKVALLKRMLLCRSMADALQQVVVGIVQVEQFLSAFICFFDAAREQFVWIPIVKLVHMLDHGALVIAARRLRIAASASYEGLRLVAVSLAARADVRKLAENLNVPLGAQAQILHEESAGSRRTASTGEPMQPESAQSAPAGAGAGQGKPDARIPSVLH